MSEAKFGEPWAVNLVGAVYSKDGQRIWGVDDGPKDELIWRAMSCINALAGIEDVEAWVKAHRELVEAVKCHKSTDGNDTTRNAFQNALRACEAAEGRKG